MSASRPLTSGITEIEALADWPQETLPATVATTVSGSVGTMEVRGYPALVVERQGRAVALRVLPTAGEQARAHAEGVVRLALQRTALNTERVTTRWSGADALTLASSPYPTTAALVEDVQLAAAAGLAGQWAAANVPLDLVRTRAQFESLVGFLRERLEDDVFRTVGVVVRVLAAWREADRAIRAASSLALLDVVSDVRDQVSRLVYPGFIARTPPEQLPHLPRYLNAARLRIERAQAGGARADAANAWLVGSLEEDLEVAAEATERMAPDLARERTLVEVRWLLEELRVSLFAQQLGTAVRVSDKRIRKLLEGA